MDFDYVEEMFSHQNFIIKFKMKNHHYEENSFMIEFLSKISNMSPDFFFSREKVKGNVRH